MDYDRGDVGIGTTDAVVGLWAFKFVCMVHVFVCLCMTVCVCVHKYINTGV